MKVSKYSSSVISDRITSPLSVTASAEAAHDFSFGVRKRFKSHESNKSEKYSNGSNLRHQLQEDMSIAIAKNNLHIHNT